MQIKILKDLPCNKKGDIISIDELRQKYGYICSKNVTNEKLIEWLENEAICNSVCPSTKFNISEWFQVVYEEIKKPIINDLPKRFFIDGLFITKEEQEPPIYNLWLTPEHYYYASGKPFHIFTHEEMCEKLQNYKQDHYCIVYRKGI